MGTVIVRIDSGYLKAKDDEGDLWSDKATKANARRLGAYLHEDGVESWLYSSSVDFPEDNGGPKTVDFRREIFVGYQEAERNRFPKEVCLFAREGVEVWLSIDPAWQAAWEVRRGERVLCRFTQLDEAMTAADEERRKIAARKKKGRARK